MMLFTWSASVMLPTAMVGTPASLRTWSLNGVWYMRPYTGRASIEVCPVDTWTMSTPAAAKARATATASSPVRPPSTQSVAEIRTDIGRSAGQASRIATKTSSG